LFEDQVVQAVGIIGAVGENLAGGQAPDQVASGRHVVLLAGAEDEAHGQAERIDDGVDLGSQTAPGATESLGRRSPLLIRAPAAWAWARMTVASIDSHSKSGSHDTAANIRSNTPCSTHR
jgi:hypothetical protein